MTAATIIMALSIQIETTIMIVGQCNLHFGHTVPTVGDSCHLSANMEHHGAIEKGVTLPITHDDVPLHFPFRFELPTSQWSSSRIAQVPPSCLCHEHRHW